jgi:predicted transcriptional regulator
MEENHDRTYAYIPRGVWMSVYDLARCMHRTVNWVRTNVRDKGLVPHSRIGDTCYFYTDDVIRFLEDAKRDPREELLD